LPKWGVFADDALGPGFLPGYCMVAQDFLRFSEGDSGWLLYVRKVDDSAFLGWNLSNRLLAEGDVL